MIFAASLQTICSSQTARKNSRVLFSLPPLLAALMLFLLQQRLWQENKLVVQQKPQAGNLKLEKETI
jgi:hypothetical protein